MPIGLGLVRRQKEDRAIESVCVLGLDWFIKLWFWIARIINCIIISIPKNVIPIPTLINQSLRKELIPCDSDARSRSKPTVSMCLHYTALCPSGKIIANWGSSRGELSLEHLYTRLLDRLISAPRRFVLQVLTFVKARNCWKMSTDLQAENTSDYHRT